MCARVSDVRELSCSACGGRFRVRAREGRELPSEIPCPNCDARIEVDDDGGDDFWVSRSHAEIFHREPKPDPAEPGDDGGEVETADDASDTSDGQGVERTSRRFREVSEARREAGLEPESNEPISDGSESQEGTAFEERELARESGAPEDAFEEARGAADEDPSSADELDPEAPDANLDVGGELELVARDGTRDFDGTPLPKPVRESEEESREGQQEEEESGTDESTPGAGIIDDGSGADRPEEETRAESFQSAIDATADEEERTVPAEELATTPFADWEEDLEEAAREGDRYDVRVHDTVERDVGVRRLVEILKEGVWSEALEVRDDGEWVPLREHEVVDTIGDYLVGQSRQILLDQEPDVPEGRAESAGARGESDASAQERHRREESAEEGRRRKGRRTQWWVAAAILGSVALIVGLAVWVRRSGLLGDVSKRSAAVEEETSSDAAPSRDTGSGPEAGAPSGTDTDRGDGFERPPADASSAVDAASSRLQRGTQAGRLAEVAFEHEDWGAARRWSARALGNGTEVDRYRKMFRDAIRRDESLVPSTLTFEEDVDIDAIHALGGGWSVSFRMTRNGQPVYAFKPAQKRWEQGWRAEIAAYRLCRILVCGFDIPRNRPVRISRETFEELYDKVEGDRQEEYRERFGDLVWRTEEGPDGEERDYLYGTLKDWVPDFADWPIEYESVWRPWLDVETDPAVLDQPLAEALEPLEGLGESNFYEQIMSERGGATTRRVARELSSLLAFDFLTTNWDRFSTTEEFYGVNNQFADGHFVSIDNGACFPPQTFDEVKRRLEPVGRFSAALVASVRAMEPSVVNPVLFPNPDWRERKKLAVFWRQRGRFLQHVRRLRARHGDPRVFAFR